MACAPEHPVAACTPARHSAQQRLNVRRWSLPPSGKTRCLHTASAAAHTGDTAPYLWQQIHLHKALSGDVVEQLLSWVYTGTLQLTPATVVPLLVTATEYELPDLQVGVCRVHFRPDCKRGAKVHVS